MKRYFSLLAILGSLLILPALDSTSGARAASPEHGTAGNPRFETIAQPLPLKLGIVAGGVILVGLELWWFLGSRDE